MFGHRIGVGHRGGKKQGFDPATLTLSGWWRASYSGSPWAGTASGGSSGGRNMSEGTNAPDVGAALNGLTPADFNGSNDLLTASVTSENIISATAWSSFVLFIADTAAADSALMYTLPQLYAAQSFEIYGIAFSTAGVSLWQHDGSARQRVDIACATGGYHLAQAKWDGSLLKLRLDSGAWSETACTGFSGLLSSTTPQLGSGASAAFFDGRIAEAGFAQTALSDATFDQILTYVNARYALTL